MKWIKNRFPLIGNMDSQRSSEALPTLEPDEVHLDAIESETDCSMDATNTIEFDHQIEYRKRQEIEHLSKLGGKAVDNELEIGKYNLECHSSYSESDGLVNISLYKDSSGPNPSSMSPATPPPLQQSRGMESHLDDKESKREAFIEGSYFDFDFNFSASTTSQQSKTAPFNQYQDIGSQKMQESKQSELQTSNRRREAKRLKGIDEKEDFLQQIRSKSLNLRPTVTGKSKYGEPTSNDHVSDILRKVVGSDERGKGDINWSDT